MKRYLSFLAAIILLFCHSAQAGENNRKTVPSYDFNLHFLMNADVLPESVRHAGNAIGSFLNSVELKGNWTACPEQDTFDLKLSLIPSGDPDAAITLRFYGFPSHTLVASSLLGEEQFFLNNEALLEFCLKAYAHLGLTLPARLTLLFPYTWQNAFQSLSEEYERYAGGISSRVIPAENIAMLADALDAQLQDETPLKDFFTVLSLESDQSSTLEAELASLPSYLTANLSNRGELTVECFPGGETWQSPERVLFSRRSDENSCRAETDLPLTENGFQPYFLFTEIRDSELSATRTLKLDYSSAGNSTDDPVTLLSAAASWDIPVRWPAAGDYLSSFSLNSELLPSFELSIRTHSEENGSFSAAFFSSSDENGSASSPAQMQPFLTVSGTVLEVPDAEPLQIDRYSIVEFYTNIFSVSDASLKEFVRKVAPAAGVGLISFLAEIPAPAIQYLMDELTETGILGLLLE